MKLGNIVQCAPVMGMPALQYNENWREMQTITAGNGYKY